MEIFKEIVINHLDEEALLGHLQEKEVQFNKYANVLFDDPSFIRGNEVEKVQLVKVNLADLGFSKPAIYQDIVSQAEKVGLRLCPLILAAYLRLSYLDQPVGPYLKVASPKVGASDDYPRGLYLRNIDGTLWLRGYRASDDWEYGLDIEFVFRR